MEECGLDYKDPNFSEERMIAVLRQLQQIGMCIFRREISMNI